MSGLHSYLRPAFRRFSISFFNCCDLTMYQLTCPQCETIHEVAAAKAGGEISCTNCHEVIAVPKLGELRNLPAAANSAAADRDASAPAGLSGGRSMAFAALGLVCLLSLLGTAFCGVNWSTTEAPMSTSKHLEMLGEMYSEVSASQLIREFEEITEYGVDVPAPLKYRTQELQKQAWGQKTIGFLALAAAAFVAALFVGRRQRGNAASA